MLTAFGTAVALGIILGLVAATGRNSWRDHIISLISLVAYATPGFWLGLMMIVIFSIGLGWLPTSGFDTVGARSRGVGRGLGHRSPSRDARRLARAVLPRALCAPHASVRFRGKPAWTT